MIVTLIAALAAVSGPTNTQVTVYNEGYAYVREVRNFDLGNGQQEVNIEDVPTGIDATSVGIKPLEGPGFSVLEQNYRYDLINPVAILSKAVGQRVRLVRTLGNARDVLEGTLISSPYAVISADGTNQMTYNGLVIKTDDGRIVLNPTGEVEVTSVPPDLISKPTLNWLIDGNGAGKQSVQMGYITSGMSWNADYVLMLGDKDEPASVQGWVTVNNQCGASFKDATLKLLAGDVNRVRGGGGAGGFVAPKMAVAKAARDDFKEETLSEYHLYTLQRPAMLRNRETKQLSLMSKNGVSVKKRIIVDSMYGYYGYYPNEGEVGVGDIKPIVKVEFMNTKENNMGIPLPKGKFKVYQNDSSGSSQMLGEDQIDHTPKNEKVSLTIGRAFDIRATRKRTNFTRLSANVFRETFEIEIRNRKDTPETVFDYERHWGDWNVDNSSMPYNKLDSNLFSYEVHLGPNETKKVTYTVTTSW